MSGYSNLRVTIMGKPYKIACPPGQEDSLRRAAAHLTGKMQEITDSGQVIGVDKIAVFAALNIAHALLQRDADKERFAARISQKIGRLTDTIESALPERDEQALKLLNPGEREVSPKEV